MRQKSINDVINVRRAATGVKGRENRCQTFKGQHRGACVCVARVTTMSQLCDRIIINLAAFFVIIVVPYVPAMAGNNRRRNIIEILRGSFFLLLPASRLPLLA
jgi:hypothetical protein